MTNGSQSRKGSLIEAVANIVLGFGVALVSQIVVLPLVGIHGVTLGTNLEITAYFTVISLVRTYLIRRMFNSLAKKY